MKCIKMVLCYVNMNVESSILFFIVIYTKSLECDEVYVSVYLSSFWPSQRNLYLTYSTTLVRAKRATRIRGGLPPRNSSIINLCANEHCITYPTCTNYVFLCAKVNYHKLLFTGVCWASCYRAGGLHSHCSWSFSLHHLLHWLLWGYQGVQGASHCLWHLPHHHICHTGLLILNCQLYHLPEQF